MEVYVIFVSYAERFSSSYFTSYKKIVGVYVSEEEAIMAKRELFKDRKFIKLGTDHCYWEDFKIEKHIIGEFSSFINERR